MVEKRNGAREATDDNIIRLMRFASWNTKTTDRHTLRAFSTATGLRERASVSRSYVRTLSVFLITLIPPLYGRSGFNSRYGRIFLFTTRLRQTVGAYFSEQRARSVNLTTGVYFSNELGVKCMELDLHGPYSLLCLLELCLRMPDLCLLCRYAAKELSWKNIRSEQTFFFVLFRKKISGLCLWQVNSRRDTFACEMSDLSCRTPGCVIYLGVEVYPKLCPLL